MNSVAIKLCGQRHRLVTELRDPSNSPAKRDHPLTPTRSFPVGREGGLPGDEPALFEVVVDEVLQRELIHIRAAA